MGTLGTDRINPLNVNNRSLHGPPFPGESIACIKRKPRTDGQIHYGAIVQLICTIFKATGFEKKRSNLENTSRFSSKLRIRAKTGYNKGLLSLVHLRK